MTARIQVIYQDGYSINDGVLHLKFKWPYHLRYSLPLYTSQRGRRAKQFIFMFGYTRERHIFEIISRFTLVLMIFAGTFLIYGSGDDSRLFFPPSEKNPVHIVFTSLLYGKYVSICVGGETRREEEASKVN